MNISFFKNSVETESRIIFFHRYHRRTVMITARQRLAQRALRSLDLAPSPPPLNPHSSGTGASGTNNDPDSIFQLALASPVALVQKHGFNVEQTEIQEQPSSFREPDDLRQLNVLLAESDQCLFVNREYMCAWSQQFSHMSSKNVQEISFPGGEAELRSILNAIWPNFKRLTVDQLVVRSIFFSVVSASKMVRFLRRFRIFWFQQISGECRHVYRMWYRIICTAIWQLIRRKN